MESERRTSEHKFELRKHAEILKIVYDKNDKGEIIASKLFIDDIEIPFTCNINIENEIITDHPSPWEILAGRPARDVKYLQGDFNCSVTIKVKGISVEHVNNEK